MSFGTFIQETLQKHTKDDVVDTRAVAEDLGFCISETHFSDAMVKGRISPTDDPYYLAEITFNATNNDTEDNTLVPLLVGQTMISIGNNESIRASQIDAFFLSDMRRYRTSPHMLLSTRLGIPEGVIRDLDELRLSQTVYMRKANLLPNFIGASSVVSGSLFSMLKGLNIGFADKLTKIRLPTRIQSQI